MMGLQYDLQLLTNWDVLVEFACKDIVEQYEIAIVAEKLGDCAEAQQLFCAFI